MTYVCNASDTGSANHTPPRRVFELEFAIYLYLALKGNGQDQGSGANHSSDYWLLFGSATRCFSNFVSLPIAKIKMIQKHIEDPTVPKFMPPFAMGLVSTSPKVAPKGRVNTKASQNSKVPEILVKKWRSAITISNPVMTIAQWRNPSPKSSARKSPPIGGV